MRILFISPSYHPNIGGVEYVVKSIAERLVHGGNEVTVLAGESKIKEVVKEEICGVNVIRWPTFSPGNSYHFPRYSKNLKDLLEKLIGISDIIHIHSIHSIFTVLIGLYVRKLNFDGKIVVTPHYHGSGHTLIRNLFWVPWGHVVNLLLQKSTIHAVSKYEAYLIKRYFKKSSVVIEHGVDEKIFKFQWRPEDYIMYSGRIEKYKNIDRLIDIAKLLNEIHNCNLTLKIYGDGPYKDAIVRKLKKLDIKFEISSFQPYDAYLNSLSRSVLFALLSEKESFGQVINEANAIGVPVVVAKPWGLNFQDRSRTLVVDLSENDRKIADKIFSFISESKKQPKPKVLGWKHVVAKYLSLYSN